MTRNFIKQEILELAGSYYRNRGREYKTISEEDRFVNELGLNEWEYAAFVTTVEMQLGINITEKECDELYSGTLSGLIDLLCVKADNYQTGC